MNKNHVKRDTVIAKSKTRKPTVNKPKGDNVAWNEYLLHSAKND